MRCRASRRTIPVVLERIDGHAILANAAAMRAAGVTAATKDPAGGRIERAANGEPTGVFVDNAMALVERVDSAALARRDARRHARRNHRVEPLRARRRCTIPASRATCSTSSRSWPRPATFSLRVYAMISDDSAAIEHYFQRGPQSALYDGHLWIRSIKLYADGALGSRGAALLDPYTDDPKNIGLLKTTPEHLRDVSTRALQHGFQVGDARHRRSRQPRRARRVRGGAQGRADGRSPLPHRARPGARPRRRAALRAARRHSVDAGRASDERHVLGADAPRATREPSARTRGGRCSTPASSFRTAATFPVERVNPLFSFHAAVSRQDDNNWPPGGWFPEQRMTRDEALKSMTIWPAFAGFQEQLTGSLTPGKYADFVDPRPRHHDRSGRRDTRHSGDRNVYWRTGGVRARSLERPRISFEASHGSTNRGSRSLQPKRSTSGMRWLTPERLTRVRAILLGADALLRSRRLRLPHARRVAPARSRRSSRKLRGVGVLTWMYALVQMVDLRFYNSRWAQRRRASRAFPTACTAGCSARCSPGSEFCTTASPRTCAGTSPVSSSSA